MATFDDLFKDIAAFEKKLVAPVSFHVSKQEAYHRTARAIAARVLADSKPPAHDAASWAHRVGKVLDRVTSDLMLGGGTMLSLTAPPVSEGGLADKAERPTNQVVTHSDVVEWIRSGVAGEEGGKKITDEDRKLLAGKNGERALATVVMRAYYSRNRPPNYVRLRRAIQRYLTGEEAASDPILDAILDAWHLHFAVRFPRDMAAHVSALVAAL